MPDDALDANVSPDADATTTAVADPPVETSDAAPAVPEPAAAAAPVSDIDDEILGIAESLGLPRAAAQGFGTRGELIAYLDKMTTSTRSQPAAAPAAAAQPATAPAGASPAEKAAFKRLDNVDFDEQFLSDLNGRLEAMHGRIGERGSGDDTIKSLQSRLNQLTQHLVVGTLDGLIGKHGEPYADVLGKGPTSGLKRDSAEYKARIDQLLPRMQAIQASSEQMNLPALSEEALFRAAVSMVFGSRAETQARDDVAQKVKERESQGIRRPAGQSNNTPDPKREIQERAAAAQERLLQSSTLNQEELQEYASSF